MRGQKVLTHAGTQPAKTISPSLLLWALSCCSSKHCSLSLICSCGPFWISAASMIQPSNACAYSHCRSNRVTFLIDFCQTTLNYSKADKTIKYLHYLNTNTCTKAQYKCNWRFPLYAHIFFQNLHLQPKKLASCGNYQVWLISCK